MRDRIQKPQVWPWNGFVCYNIRLIVWLVLHLIWLTTFGNRFCVQPTIRVCCHLTRGIALHICSRYRCYFGTGWEDKSDTYSWARYDLAQEPGIHHEFLGWRLLQRLQTLPVPTRSFLVAVSRQCHLAGETFWRSNKASKWDKSRQNWSSPYILVHVRIGLEVNVQVDSKFSLPKKKKKKNTARLITSRCAHASVWKVPWNFLWPHCGERWSDTRCSDPTWRRLNANWCWQTLSRDSSRMPTTPPLHCHPAHTLQHWWDLCELTHSSSSKRLSMAVQAITQSTKKTYSKLVTIPGLGDGQQAVHTIEA